MQNMFLYFLVVGRRKGMSAAGQKIKVGFSGPVSVGAASKKCPIYGSRDSKVSFYFFLPDSFDSTISVPKLSATTMMPAMATIMMSSNA